MYHCLLFRKLERISSLHVSCSCLNRMMFLERNVDIGMHVIRLNLLENTMDARFLCTTVYCLENWKEFLVCMCRVLV